jgi:hypothetical protein
MPRLAVAIALALALAIPPREADASPPPGDDATPADLFRDGQAKADAADYVAAIAKFEQAFALLPDVEANEGTRNRLRVELVRSHKKAFKIDSDPTHLTRAKVILDDYVASLDPSQAESLEWADFERLEIDAMLRDFEAKRPTPTAESPRPAPALEIEPAPEPADDRPPPNPDAGKGLLVGGGVLLGLGVGSAVLMAAGLGKARRSVSTFENQPDRREAARRDNRIGNSLGIAGGIAAGVLFTAGAILMALGGKKRSEARTAVVPVFDGDQVGAVLRARF